MTAIKNSQISNKRWPSFEIIASIIFFKDGITHFYFRFFYCFSKNPDDPKSQTHFFKGLKGFIINAPSTTCNPWCSAWCVIARYQLLHDHWFMPWWSSPLLLPPNWSWKFSTMDFIHTKLWNRLSTTYMEKLVYVNTNMGVFYNSFHESS